jgi:hypothetical protein
VHALLTLFLAPIASFATPSYGFIDDAFALRDDGKAIAYLVTDGATQAELHLAEIPAGKTDVVVKGVSPHATSLHWLSDTRVMVVSRDNEKMNAQVYDAKGPTKLRFGPADGIGLTDIEGKPAIVTYSHVDKKTVEHTITAFSRDDGKPLGKRVLKEDADGQVAHAAGAFKILWWRDGFTSAATLKAGEYDKKRDIRRPNRFAHYDVWRGKLSNEKEIEDLIAFAQVGILRKQHNNEVAFVHLSDDHRQLLLADGLDENEIKPKQPLYMYDATQFQSQLAGDKVFVSATIDPANPPAIERKHLDPNDFELYQVDRFTRDIKGLLRVPGDGRGVGWRIAGHRVALLRKSKGFDRGGVALEIHDL